MAARIVGLIRESGSGVPFSQVITRLKADGYETDGDFSIEMTPNVVVWAGISSAVVDAINAVKTSREAHVSPLGEMEALLIYSWEGAPMLALPYAKKPPARGYKRPHWLATVWHLGPGPCQSCRT